MIGLFGKTVVLVDADLPNHGEDPVLALMFKRAVVMEGERFKVRVGLDLFFWSQTWLDREDPLYLHLRSIGL